MRIRILQAVSGLTFSWTAGDLVDLDEEEAARWADGVRAELVDDQQAPPGSDGAPPYNPSEHSVKDVLAYLDGAAEEEVSRVLDIEEAGENRKGIAKEREALLQRARARDQEQAAGGEQQAAEKAAEASRGGGRGGGIETR